MFGIALSGANLQIEELSEQELSERARRFLEAPKRIVVEEPAHHLKSVLLAVKIEVVKGLSG